MGVPAALRPAAAPQVRFPIVPTPTQTHFAVSTPVPCLSVSGLEFRLDFALASRLLLVPLATALLRLLPLRRSLHRRYAHTHSNPTCCQH